MAKADSSRVLPNTSPFDQSKVQTERQAATERLLSRLNALDRTQRAPSARAYAYSYIREQESLILQLLDAGVAPSEILADLVITFPSIPRRDLHYAIGKLRERRRRKSSIKSTPAQARGVGEPSVFTKQAPLERQDVVAGRGDQRPDESDEDYRLRRALEGPGAIKRDFIGE